MYVLPVPHRCLWSVTMTTTRPMTTWSRVKRQGLSSTPVTSCRSSIRMTSTGGRWVHRDYFAMYCTACNTTCFVYCFCCQYYQPLYSSTCAYRYTVCVLVGLSIDESIILWVCQARRCVEGGSAGLIPSQLLEEKRKAFVKRDVELAPAGRTSA